MSSIAIFKTGRDPQYIPSVNTPDYISDPDVIVNPDISAVQNVPFKYWKRSGDVISEMSAAEKQAVEDAALNTRKTNADEFAVSLKDAMTALITVINIRLPAGQKITKAEMITAIKAVMT